MGIIGNRFIDLFLGIKGAAATAVQLAPWPDEESRALFWSIATLIDSMVDATRQSLRMAIGAPDWPADAIHYLCRGRGLLVPRQEAFDWRGWIGAHWAQHAISGTSAGIIAGCNASHPQQILNIQTSDEGWWLGLPDTVGVPEWDDGTDWDEGPAWDVDVEDLTTLYRAARYWGPAKLFLGAVPLGG